MDNRSDKDRSDRESKPANVILCHPDEYGDPVADVFGDVPSTLVTMVTKGWDNETRYSKMYPKHVGCLEIGFREQGKERWVKKDWSEYWGDVASEVLMIYNGSDPYWKPCRDPDLAVALAIADDHAFFADHREGENLIVTEITSRACVSHGKNETYYEDELNGITDAFLEYLTFDLGFRWEWMGWDQEPRFIQRGLVRVPGTKIVQNLDGEYVISPRCHYCGEKTGFCQCSTDLEEMKKEMAERHRCNDCYFLQEFEDKIDEYLFNGKPDQNILDDIERMFSKMGAEAGFDTEYNIFLNKEEAIEALTDIFRGDEPIEVLEWYEIIALYWEQWTNIQQEHLDDGADDMEGYCECPLGVD